MLPLTLYSVSPPFDGWSNVAHPPCENSRLSHQELTGIIQSALDIIDLDFNDDIDAYESDLLITGAPAQ